nr:right-handed parallel beta-helix repeat-containing protein [FCB group bacterium]
CIDAGDPAGQRDFDGTTADMGAFIYAQLDPSELRGALIDEGASFGTMTTEYNPYTAATDIWVSEGDTLIIDPGVQIMFEAGTELRFSFIDSGVVIAKGTESDPIVFTSSRSTGAYRGDWESIKLIGDGSTAHADTFYNCIIEYGTSVQAMSGYAHFENCMFSDIQDYVLVEKSSGAASVSCTFEMCRFENIGLAGIKILNPAGASSIKHCIFNQNEAYGIHLYNAGNLVSITNNLFLENAINGIRCENFSSPAILNNTISANSYHGINCVKNSNPTIQNNIIINNVNYGVRCQEASNPVIKFNDIYGNLSGNFNNCPSGVGKWISHGIVIQPNGHGGSGKSIELYKTMNDGRISRSFTYADSISIDLFLQGRSDVSNNHFQINIDDGEYIPGSNAFAVQYKYGEMFILKDNVTATKKNIEFGSSDWYNLIMRRSSAGDWIMLWGGEEAALTGNMSLPGETQSVFVSQNYAYLCNGSDGLNIVNVSNPASPSLTGSYNTPGSANHVFVFGNYAYVADGDSGVAIINISSRSNPQLVQRFQTPGYASALALKENYLYVAAMDSGLRVLNISNLDSIYETAHFETMGQACGLTKYGNYLYLANGDAGLKTYNVTNAASVTAAGTFDTPGYANKVSVYGNYAYVADKEGGMRIINKANPSILSETAFFVTADDSAMGVFAEGSHAYITAGNILYVIDVSYPAKPLLAAELEIQGEGLGVYGFNNYTYIASGTQGLYIADASNMPVTLQVQDALGVSDSLSISLLSLSSTGEGGLRADDILLKDEITASDILNETFDSYITFADMQNAGWSFDFTDWRNNKSDNCDQFRNICIDPMVDEDYHLLSGSPSRESGLLNIAGTDTTYTDMGAFGGADGAWTPLEFIVNPLP